jgi:hypothetical protein
MGTKKNDSSAPSFSLLSLPRGLVSLFQGETRPLALALLILAMFGAFWYIAWQQVRNEVLASPDYWLTLERVEITPLPPWIHSDIRAEVFRDASLDGPLSILAPDLAERISKAFALHPWVAKVRRVQKSHPARVQVELVYRQPVCMVIAPGGPLPVDAEGVLLPRDDFSPVEISRYPHLVNIGSMPVGPVGTRWGDPRVVGGAEIAAVVGPAWDELGLDRMVPSAAPESGSASEYLYELHTRGGTRILWGRAPGTDLPGEIRAEEKLARLKRYQTEHGTLEGPHGPQQLDVRSLRSMQGSAQPQVP